MQKISFFLIAWLPCLLFAQTGLKDIRKKSYELFAFKIAAAEAEKYIKQASIPVDEFLKRRPLHIFHKDSVDTHLLPKGQYVFISVSEGEVIASVEGISGLLLLPLNNGFNIMFNIATPDGTLVPNAKVWVNNKAAKYDAQAKTYILKQKKTGSGLVKIFTPGDTAFVALEKTESYGPSLARQRWKNFTITRSGRVITYLPKKIGSLFKKRRSYKRPKSEGSGYVLFSQPKYRLTDTVKLKAYLVNRKWKRYRKTVDIFLEYSDRDKFISQLLTHLPAVSPGSYVYSFPLHDTLPLDERYNVVFKTSNGKLILSKSFSTEDYLLDEMGSYQFRIKSENYYPGDTMQFYASAKDANGLSLLDGKATLILTAYAVKRFFADSLRIPDTLFQKELPLLTDGETPFSVPANTLPYAELSVKATLVFKNSNNESHEETDRFDYLPLSKKLEVHAEADSVFATFRINGKPVKAEGVVKISGDEIDLINRVTFPARIKINPLAGRYEFIMISGRDTLTERTDIDNDYRLAFSRISRHDTLGFTLHNPYHLPVNYIVLDGNKIVYAGSDDKESITWKRVVRNIHKMYTLKWQYMWAGESVKGYETIALLYKLLQVKINNEPAVFPGQKDSVTIEVKDYKNRPAGGVNLAAVAYNSQFKKDIQVKEPPYLVKYRHKPTITIEEHETGEPYIVKRYLLGEHVGWLKRMELDTLPFYKILFPRSFPYDATSRISDFIPQLSIHVVKKGRPQEIYLLYINRQLVYYNGVTEKMEYAFQTLPGYSQVGIRLSDRYIEIDSLYIQPFYKHDMVIDADSLPAHTTVKKMPDYWMPEERKLIEKSIWQLDNNSRTNNGFVWQEYRLVQLRRYSRHLTGPFSPFDSLHFYAPGNFAIDLVFEPGYEYNLSPNISRLEKKSIFPRDVTRVFLPYVNSPLVLGDTIVPLPVVDRVTRLPEPFIRANYYHDHTFYNHKPGLGKLKFTTAKDTVLKYVVLYNTDTAFSSIALEGNVHEVYNIRPGKYTLLLINRQFETAEIKGMQIYGDQMLCFNAASHVYEKGNVLVKELIAKSMEKLHVMVKREAYKIEAENNVPLPRGYPVGNCSIKGQVIDTKGKIGIPYVEIKVEGTAGGTFSEADGNFLIRNIKEGKYRLVVTSVGYVSKLINVVAERGQEVNIIIRLSMSEQSLTEVVVTAMGIRRKTSMAGSISTIRGEELTANMLQGKVAGISVQAPAAEEHLMLRGIESLEGDNGPIYVVDGIIYTELPANLRPEMIQSLEVLKDAAATAVYGARGANGVVIISTGTKKLRNTFKDNAIWQPEMFTNAEGKASFEAVYPDNITGWELYVLAMDKKRRMGKGVSFTKAYKPVMAQLNTPQFLIIDDSVHLVGKAMNHTEDKYSIQAQFTLDGDLRYAKDTLLPARASSVMAIPVSANAGDTLHTSFTLKSTTGFNDGEERKIPVFKRGAEEAGGSFYVLSTDTVISFTPLANHTPIEVYAQDNTLEVLLLELDRLKRYPYYCMEQIASKLKGLLMEQQIRELFKQPFTNGKELNILLKKLTDNQLFDGGWSWWEKGKADVRITTYVVEALLAFRKDPLVETNIRNGLLFLQNRLAHVKQGELLQILACMSTAGHVMDYKTYMNTLDFDSLTLHQQWQWIKISQRQKLDYARHLQQLIAKQSGTITGGIYWGTENYLWYSNTIATTVTAWSVLEKEKNYQYVLPAIIQYFLEQRRQGFWRNTVEAATIASAILPYLLAANKNFDAPARLTLSGDTSITISSFPWSARLRAKSANPIIVRKTGGGLTYLTLYQQWWNERPQAITGNFDITTCFEKNGQKVAQITAGEKVKMIIKLNVIKEAEYVMIEVPLPAGCTYAKKEQDWGMHKEFYKNKVVLFPETLKKGMHEFEVELEARYKGLFTLNPAQAELMYFPVLSGRNEMRKVEIK